MPGIFPISPILTVRSFDDSDYTLSLTDSADKAFRHGDIENVLEELAKTVGGAAMGSGLLGIASSVIGQVTGGSKFSKSDIKKVYFVRKCLIFKYDHTDLALTREIG